MLHLNDSQRGQVQSIHRGCAHLLEELELASEVGVENADTISFVRDIVASTEELLTPPKRKKK